MSGPERLRHSRSQVIDNGEEKDGEEKDEHKEDFKSPAWPGNAVDIVFHEQSHGHKRQYKQEDLQRKGDDRLPLGRLDPCHGPHHGRKKVHGLG
jgi:hypothetical protein